MKDVEYKIFITAIQALFFGIFHIMDNINTGKIFRDGLSSPFFTFTAKQPISETADLFFQDFDFRLIILFFSKKKSIIFLSSSIFSISV